MVTLATFGLTVFLYIFVPKGFFPQQDTGADRLIVADQATSFQLMSKLLEQYAKIVAQDPGVDNGSPSAADRRQWRDQHRPGCSSPSSPCAGESWRRRRSSPASAKSPSRPRRQFVLQSVQDLRIGGRASLHNTSHPAGRRPQRLNSWAPKVLAKVKTLPGLVDVTSDQQDRGLQASLIYDVPPPTPGHRRAGPGQYPYDAFGQRQVSTTYTQLNQYHVVMEVEPQLLAESGRTQERLHPLQHRPPGPARLRGTLCFRPTPRWPSTTRASSRR